MIFRHLRCASYGFEVINDIVKHEKEYKKNRPCLTADEKLAECKFAGETDKSMIKIMAVTSHSDEFVEFGQNKSLPKWLENNGIKTNHDFDGNGKLCNKLN
jgi:hypothetical protein